MNGNGVNPASMPVVACHDGPNNQFIDDCNEKKVVLVLQFFVDSKSRPVMRILITENVLPQSDDLATMRSVIEQCYEYGCHWLSGSSKGLVDIPNELTSDQCEEQRGGNKGRLRVDHA